MKHQLLYLWRGDHYSFRPSCKREAERLKLAFVSLNSPHFTDFLIVPRDVRRLGRIPEKHNGKEAGSLQSS